MTCDEQSVKATITELKYDSVKSKLIKIFSDNSQVPASEFNNMHIKTEPVYHTHPTQKITPSENSIQLPYQPECSSQSHLFETTTQHSHSSQSSQAETLKPNISSQYSQSIKKLKPHSTIRYKLINDSNWINAEINKWCRKSNWKIFKLLEYLKQRWTAIID